MKNKNSLSENGLSEAVPERLLHPNKIEVEKKLLPRLKFMGYIFSFLAVVTLIFAMVVKEESPPLSQFTQIGFPVLEEIEAASGLSLLVEEGELELNALEVLNFYMVSFLFAAVGTSCFLITWKKRKKLFH